MSGFNQRSRRSFHVHKKACFDVDLATNFTYEKILTKHCFIVNTQQNYSFYIQTIVVILACFTFSASDCCWFCLNKQTRYFGMYQGFAYSFVPQFQCVASSSSPQNLFVAWSVYGVELDAKLWRCEDENFRDENYWFYSRSCRILRFEFRKS